MVTRLQATDRRSAAPWTAGVLALIRAHPATRAGDLAPRMGWETPVFKANVRKLKALGLTQSLETGPPHRPGRAGRRPHGRRSYAHLTPVGHTERHLVYNVIRTRIPNARVMRIIVANVGFPLSDNAL